MLPHPCAIKLRMNGAPGTRLADLQKLVDEGGRGIFSCPVSLTDLQNMCEKIKNRGLFLTAEQKCEGPDPVWIRAFSLLILSVA